MAATVDQFLILNPHVQRLIQRVQRGLGRAVGACTGVTGVAEGSVSGADLLKQPLPQASVLGGPHGIRQSPARVRSAALSCTCGGSPNQQQALCAVTRSANSAQNLEPDANRANTLELNHVTVISGFWHR